jgi:hypothetical protein
MMNPECDWLNVTRYGFRWWGMQVDRISSDKIKGWAVLGIKTNKTTGHGIQIYVTRTGNICIRDEHGEVVFERKKKL